MATTPLHSNAIISAGSNLHHTRRNSWRILKSLQNANISFITGNIVEYLTFAPELHIHRKIIKPSSKLARVLKVQQWPDTKRMHYLLYIKLIYNLKSI